MTVVFALSVGGRLKDARCPGRGRLPHRPWVRNGGAGIRPREYEKKFVGKDKQEGGGQNLSQWWVRSLAQSMNHHRMEMKYRNRLTVQEEQEQEQE